MYCNNKFYFFTLCSICLTLFACNRLSERKHGNLSVTAKVCGRANKIDYKQSNSNGYLFIDMTLTNQSDFNKSIWFFSCDWMKSWIIEPYSISFYSEGCDGNYPRRFDLKPNQSINFHGIIENINNLVDSSHFRIGFADFNETDLKATIPPPPGLSLKKLNPKVYWSNWLSSRFCNNSYVVSK